MLSVKQGGIKYHFLTLWYDSTRDWTQVFSGIDEHSNHYNNIRYKYYYLTVIILFKIFYLFAHS